MSCNLFWVGMLSGIQGIRLVQVRTTYTYYGHTRQQIEAQHDGVQMCLVGIPAVSTRSLALMNTQGVHVTDND
jgi:Iap family predicted aminopeptidase